MSEKKQKSYIFSIFLLLFVIFIALIIIYIIKKKSTTSSSTNEANDFIAGFISDDNNTQSQGQAKEVSEFDKEKPKETREEVEDTGLTPEEFLSLFFPDPTKSPRNALEFADSVVDTIQIGRVIYKTPAAILKFYKYIGSTVGGKAFSSFVSTRIQNGAKLGSSFFKTVKNSKLVLKGSRVIRGNMVYKSISKFLTANKNLFLRMGVSTKALFSRLGVKSSKYATKFATRLASTSAAKGAVSTAKSVESGVKTAYNSVKAVKTAVAASKTGIKVAQVGAKAASTAKNIASVLAWPLLIFDITNIILDLTDVAGYGDIGYKSEFYKIRDEFIESMNDEMLEVGFLYPFIYGPNIDEDKIYESIQSRIVLSFQNSIDDRNDLTYAMRQEIKKDLESGKLTFQQLGEDNVISEYYKLVDSEKLFREEYDSICKNNDGEIVEIDDRFSVYDKKENIKYTIDVNDSIFTNSLQKCENEFSKKSASDNSYVGFSYSESLTDGEFIDFNRLNDGTFICILEADKNIYKRKTLESPLQYVDMSLNGGSNIKMNKVIQLKNNIFVGISNFKLYTCPEFNEDAVWTIVANPPDEKIISICELNNGEFAVIKDDNLLYNKKTLEDICIKIFPVSIEIISITKNNDGTLLAIGKDNFIYTQNDINLSQVSTRLGSAIQGFQTLDNLYVFLGTDLRLYFKTSLQDKLLDPYELMDFNCRFLKDSNMSNYNKDDDTDVYIKNNTQMKKMKVCSYKKEKCKAQWPQPEENDPKSDDYTYHEYKNNILGPNKGACVLRDSRMRIYCEDNETKKKYPDSMKNKTYDLNSGSCLVDEEYCLSKGVEFEVNNTIGEKDCFIPNGQDVAEFLFGTTTTRAIKHASYMAAQDIVNGTGVLGGAISKADCILNPGEDCGKSFKDKLQDSFFNLNQQLNSGAVVKKEPDGKDCSSSDNPGGIYIYNDGICTWTRKCRKGFTKTNEKCIFDDRGNKCQFYGYNAKFDEIGRCMTTGGCIDNYELKDDKCYHKDKGKLCYINGTANIDFNFSNIGTINSEGVCDNYNFYSSQPCFADNKFNTNLDYENRNNICVYKDTGKDCVVPFSNGIKGLYDSGGQCIAKVPKACDSSEKKIDPNNNNACIYDPPKTCNFRNTNDGLLIGNICMQNKCVTNPNDYSYSNGSCKFNKSGADCKIELSYLPGVYADGKYDNDGNCNLGYSMMPDWGDMFGGKSWSWNT